MFDFNALISAIAARVAATVALGSLSGKVGYGVLPATMSRPRCRISPIGNDNAGVYGGVLIEDTQLQFSIFADDLATATVLQQGLIAALHAQPLTITGGQTVGVRVVDRRVVHERQEPSGYVVHAMTTFVFKITS